eukprot:GILJ01005823.1.p1 GENE.GILJ01005823.1~~GILJ01005823.1.p1  ORF type:complete len:192 (+),score=11.30 GILJ01005823.1:46-576(+)
MAWMNNALILCAAIFFFTFAFLEWPSHPQKTLSLSGHSTLRMQSLLQADEDELPPKKEEIGRAAWSTMHAFAAHFPIEPTSEHSQAAIQFVALIGELFPCKKCSAHFKELIEKMPVKAGSRDELSRWLCEAHNHVNERLHKRVFNCTKAVERWGGECGCAKNITTEAVPIVPNEDS